MDVVTRENADLYNAELDEMFRLRFRFFVEKMGWSDLHKPDGRERDQFDNGEAIYLLLMNEGEVVGTHRLLATTKPHLFTDVFPDFCNVRGIQRAPDIYEAGRTCLEERFMDRQTLRKMRRLLMLGLFEFCARAGIRQFTTLCPLYVVHQYLRIGVPIKPLGVPVEMDGLAHLPCAWPTTSQDLGAVQSAFNIHEPTVRYVGIAPPAVGNTIPAHWNDNPSLTSMTA